MPKTTALTRKEEQALTRKASTATKKARTLREQLDAINSVPGMLMDGLVVIGTGYGAGWIDRKWDEISFFGTAVPTSLLASVLLFGGAAFTGQRELALASYGAANPHAYLMGLTGQTPGSEG